MSETNGAAERFPAWFRRLIVATAISWAALAVGQLVGGVWWAATLSAKVDSIQMLTTQTVNQHGKDIDDLQDDVKVIEDKIANIKRDLAVLLDRGGTIRVQKE